MFRIFRQIRKNYISEGKTNKYLKYAVGEILLVVIGILIALQVNNWNQSRIKEKQFKVTLDHIFTSIKVDQDILVRYQNALQDQIEMANEILVNSENIDSQLLLTRLFYIESDPVPYSSETAYQLSNLVFDPSNETQNNVAKRIAVYVNNEWWQSLFSTDHKMRENYVEPILRSSDITSIPTSFSFPPSKNQQTYTHVFSEKDIADVRNLIFSRKFQNALNTLVLNKTYLSGMFSINIEDSRSILSAIKLYYPDVQLLFENIGIVGNALESGWSTSVPMTCIDDKEQIWELKIQLSTGRVKFRANDSWAQNWGANSYAPETLLMNGDDIHVAEGFYHIRVNLSTNEYSIKPVPKDQVP
ncbi:MAG: hypothetical protein HKN89_02335 [Eudoraea sp.]|nr:hypothetical protein [Eudoraea sp.]